MSGELTIHDDVVVFDPYSCELRDMGCGWTSVQAVTNCLATDDGFDEYTILIKVDNHER